MQVFSKEYTTYYDMLYRGKDYGTEADYVAGLLRDAGVTGGNLIDVGCGTGKHLACMRQKGFSVSGVDMSEGMIERARENLGGDTELMVADSMTFAFGRQFDAATSLFHVISYLTDTDDVISTFANISRHLIGGGVFVFDFWHGAGCLTDFPKTKILRLEDEHTKLVRLTEPEMHPETNVIDVNFEVHLTDKASGRHSVIHETHRMRYFFLPELECYLRQAGLRISGAYKWLTRQEPGFDSWYGVIVAKKE